MAPGANRRAYVPNPALQPLPENNSCPQVAIDLSALPSLYTPPPPTGSPSPASVHNATERTYGAIGSKPTVESLLAKIEKLKSATFCPAFIKRAKLGSPKHVMLKVGQSMIQ